VGRSDDQVEVILTDGTPRTGEPATWGSGQRQVNCLGNMGSIQRETRPSIQREDQLTMETKLEQIAAKARREPKLRFTSLAHHITRDRVRKTLLQIPKWSAAGVDGQTVEAAKKSFDGWIEPMLQSIHRQGYRAPDIRRVYIPKPGKAATRRANCHRPGAPAQHGRSDVCHL
jgi:hypothetical protein